ncbi:MAG: amidinotransferase [Ignavibacteria bacterium]|nr:amidinotransferase [Ignavibacteria bacterium]
MQTTHTVLMIAPVQFGFNPDAAETNSFMEADTGLSGEARQKIQAAAREEFMRFVEVLRKAGMNVITVEDTPVPHTPDSIFPNNWISTHDDGRIVLYPMEPENRRLERRADIVIDLANRFGFAKTEDLSGFEDNGIFLEGTGSLVLDRDNKIAYANRSSRMHSEALQDFAQRMGFTALEFTSRRKDGGQIYHTNVMMAVGDGASVICADVIPDAVERQAVLDSLRQHQRVVVEISEAQMDEFAGNMLHLRNSKGEKFWVMSSRAYNALTPEQIKALEHNSSLLHAPLDVIERYGGGSARCMLAEIFVPEKD